jgi:hypothetical protein
MKLSLEYLKIFLVWLFLNNVQVSVLTIKMEEFGRSEKSQKFGRFLLNISS